jgi:hypothetical protein
MKRKMRLGSGGRMCANAVIAGLLLAVNASKAGEAGREVRDLVDDYVANCQAFPYNDESTEQEIEARIIIIIQSAGGDLGGEISPTLILKRLKELKKQCCCEETYR